MLRAAREDQVKNKEHFLAVQAARDRAEFERVLKWVPLLFLTFTSQVLIFFSFLDEGPARVSVWRAFFPPRKLPTMSLDFDELL